MPNPIWAPALAALVMSGTSTAAHAFRLNLTGVAVGSSFGEVLAVGSSSADVDAFDSSHWSTSFVGQPVDFSFDIAGSPGSYYVQSFRLTWSDQTYDLPFITSWSGSGSQYVSSVDLNSSSGGIDLQYSPTDQALLDEGGDFRLSLLDFRLDFALNSPIISGQSITVPATGEGSLDISGSGSSADIGPYQADSSVTFQLFRLTQAPSVPEPSAWTLMFVGFGAIGGAIRLGRRRIDARLPV